MRLAMAGLFVACVAASAAMAQDRPPIVPTRDVVLTYAYHAGPLAGSRVTISWAQEARLWRMDMPGAYIVADLGFRHGFMAMDAQRVVVDLDMEPFARRMHDLETARFTRGETDRVAGVSCTVWHFEGALQSGTDCISEDGIWLRGQTTIEGEHVAGEAVRVTHGRVNPARYQRPRGYQTSPAPPELVFAPHAASPPRR